MSEAPRTRLLLHPQRFRDIRGMRPPSAVFAIDSKRVRIIFNCQTAERYGLGSTYHSANLYYSEDPANPGEGEVRLDLYPSSHFGDRRIFALPNPHSNCAPVRYAMCVTRFVLRFGLRLREHAYYSVRFEKEATVGSNGSAKVVKPASLSLDLSDWEAMTRRGAAEEVEGEGGEESGEESAEEDGGSLSDEDDPEDDPDSADSLL